MMTNTMRALRAPCLMLLISLGAGAASMLPGQAREL